MPPFFEISVVRFQSSPYVEWAIAVIFMPTTGQSMVYKLSFAIPSSSSSPPNPGSGTDPVSLDVPQSITLREGADGYLGRVPVGRVDQDRLHQFSKTLMALQVPSPGCSDTSCEPVSHRWVIDALASLREEGHFIERHVTKQWLLEKLGK